MDLITKVFQKRKSNAQSLERQLSGKCRQENEESGYKVYDKEVDPDKPSEWLLRIR